MVVALNFGSESIILEQKRTAKVSILKHSNHDFYAGMQYAQQPHYTFMCMIHEREGNNLYYLFLVILLKYFAFEI